MATQLTVRGIDPLLHESLKKAAGQQGLSVNKFIVHALKQAVGLCPQKSDATLFHDLDFLAGTWTDKEYDEFMETIADQSRIDWEMWE